MGEATFSVNNKVIIMSFIFFFCWGSRIEEDHYLTDSKGNSIWKLNQNKYYCQCWTATRKFQSILILMLALVDKERSDAIYYRFRL